MIWKYFISNSYNENKILFKYNNVTFLEMINIQKHFFKIWNKHKNLLFSNKYF